MVPKEGKDHYRTRVPNSYYPAQLENIRSQLFCFSPAILPNMFPTQFILTSMLVAAGLAARINVRQDSESTVAAGVSISVGVSLNI